MPRVSIGVGQHGEMAVLEENDPDGLPVDMNASLLRQIKAADKKYWKFQRVLARLYTEAYEHPDTVRRVR